MLGLSLNKLEKLSLLCLGAHCDDIEIGCGATILSLLSSGRDIDCTWVTFCSNPLREAEARKSASRFLRDAREPRVDVYEFRDGFLPYLGYEVKDCFETLKGEIDPDLILTHYRDDRHQDHRLVSDLTYNTFRDHLILEYEVPKYDGDIGRPSVYVPLSEEHSDEKIAILLDCYASQKSKEWFTGNLFRSMLRIRGMEINAGSTLAEAFYCRKLPIVSL